VYDYTQAKYLLDVARKACRGKDHPIPEAYEKFNEETNDGRDMSQYSELLDIVIHTIQDVKAEKDIDSLFSGLSTSALAKVDRLIPKNKFYEQGKANSKLEQLFVDQVENIRWAYKLASSTIHIQDQEDLKEIQIFRVKSRVENLDVSILSFIDKLILTPIIFEVVYQNKVKVVASYKRLNQANKTKAVIGQYYASDWLEDTNRVELPLYLKLADLYEHFIAQLLPITSNEDQENADESVSIELKLQKAQQLERLQKQLNKLKSKLRNERQFNRKQLDELIGGDFALLQESVDIECKLAIGKDGKGGIPSSLWETYSAFANTDGGIIILGAKELKGGTFEAKGIENLIQIRADLFNTLNNSSKINKNLLTDQSVREWVVDGKKLLVIAVPRASRKQQPIYLNNNPLNNTYIRQNEGDYKLDDEHVKRMLAEQAHDDRDDEILANFGLDDLAIESLRSYRQRYSNLNPNAELNDLPDIEFLRRIGAYGINRETGVRGLTKAGLLMFGMQHTISEIFPNYMVDYQERPYAQTEARWIDRVVPDGSWSGNLYDFYRKVYNKLIQDLKIPFELKDGVRQEDTPVHIALREALVNCIVHADYTDRASILVVKRPDMFGFRNPGLMRIPLEHALKGSESDCRNRKLHQMFRLINVGEQAGS
ncbi:hypothetical protein GWI33_010060, partial [Rhynchophorus ferrugineus]